MKKNFVKAILILVSGFVLNSGYGQDIIVKNGKADLKNADTDKNIVNLKGNWEFYDYELYTPEDFCSGKVKAPEYFPVPGLWNKLKKNKSGEGYGTYRIKITNLRKNKLYALNLNRVQSAYGIWIDGKKFAEEGKPGRNKKETKPRWSSKNIIFKTTSDTVEIIIQVSNFYHKKGGIEHPVIFGSENVVFDYTRTRIMWNFLLLGIFLIMVAYHTAAFIFRTNDKSNLYFSLTLVFSALFSMTVGEILLADIIPSLSWEILVKTNYISNYLRVLFFALFIYHAFPEELNKKFFKVLTFAILSVILFIIVTPASIYTRTLILFLIITFIVLTYLIIGQIKAMIKKRPGALYSFVGILILIGTATNDILKELQIIDSVSLTTFGVFIFIILHSYLITLQNAFSYKTVKKITENIGIRGKIKDALFSAQSYDLTAPLSAVSEVIGADRALIFIYSDNDWKATNEYNRKTGVSKSTNIRVLSGKENKYFSYYNIQRTIASGEPVYTVVNEAVKAKDMKYLEGSGIYSILSYPLVKDGIVWGLLYFENYEERKNFEKQTLEILEDIKPQILVFMDNFTSYNDLRNLNIKLEKDVEQKTKEIEKRTEELKILREDLEKQNVKIFETSKKLEKQTEQINDGINYSEKIQKALLQDKIKFKKIFPHSFIYEKSASKLLNTFYMFHEINENEIVFVSSKARASGVSGALMTVLVNRLINDIIVYRKNYSPKIILKKLQDYYGKIPENAVSSEIAVFYLNKKKNELLFSGAGSSVFYSYEDYLIEYKSGTDPIGKENGNSKRFYSNKRISVNKGTELFILSGFFDVTEENYSEDKDKIIKKLLEISDKTEEEIFNVLNSYSEKNDKNDFIITGIKF